MANGLSLAGDGLLGAAGAMMSLSMMDNGDDVGLPTIMNDG